MTCTIERLTRWEQVLAEALNTVGVLEVKKSPSSDWKKKILLARHSPIRALEFRIRLVGIRYWVSVHLCRHSIGITHYVRSQRDDRNPARTLSRDGLPQSALVNHDLVLNAESIINISKKRLCMQASKETREVWQAVVEELKRIGEVELASFCKPECWWCGNECPEMRPCGMRPPKTMPEV